MLFGGLAQNPPLKLKPNHNLNLTILFSFSVPEYEIIQIHSVRHKRSASGLDDVHRVNLETHGRQYRLELKPNHHLVPLEREIDLWYADAFPTNVSYSPVAKVS